jgi:hypothetical protein
MIVANHILYEQHAFDVFVHRLLCVTSEYLGFPLNYKRQTQRQETLKSLIQSTWELLPKQENHDLIMLPISVLLEGLQDHFFFYHCPHCLYH